ncbi:MAG: PD-(D/E)XK nuclease family protein [Clostridiales bacterium]|nr:PD-(D/E)XK nuclease family protein [Clostridiales bacterium]
MDKKILTENTFADALERAVALIRARKPDLSQRYILFVPDKYTLLAEKLLYDGTAGAFDAEVLTLNRLYYRLQKSAENPPKEKPLGRIGAILHVRRILTENEKELQCLKRSVPNASFAETVYDNLCQLMASGLHADDLPDSVAGATGLKVRDLKILYEAYERATRGKYVDSAGRLRLLIALIKNGDALKNVHAFFACYDGLTALQREAIDAICEKAASATVVETDAVLSVRGRVETYEAPSRADELKAAAVRIRAYAARGVPYGDMGVVASSAEFHRLQRIFKEYDIPFFTDKQYILSLHPLARYVCDLLAAVQSGRNEDFIRLSKNPYTGIASEEADAFENYVYACALGEGGLRYPFKEPQDAFRRAERDRAEAVRKILESACAKIDKRKITSGVALLRYVKAVLQNAPALSLPSPIDDACEKIEEAATVLAEVYGEARFDTLTEAFSSSLASVGVSVLPNRADVVEVGEPSVFRASRKRVLFVLGFHDGELPAVMTDDGLLSDRELDGLREVGAAIEPKIRERNTRAEKELISVLSSSSSLWISRVEGYAPSSLFFRLERLAAASHDFARERQLLSDHAAQGARGKAREALLCGLCPTAAAARELMQIGQNDRAAGGVGFGYESTLEEALKNAGQSISPFTAAQDEINASGLYFAHGVSVSRVQEYFTCPLRCFLRVGLRLEPRPDGTLTPVDLGTFMHRVIEQFVRGGDFSHPEQTVPAIVARVLNEDERLQERTSETQIAALVMEAVALSGVVAKQIEQGEFTVRFLEAEFGKKDSRLRGINIVLGGKTYTLDGVIDRFDVCGNAARIIDYKTGDASFAPAAVYYGRRIQLAVYLKAAMENGYAPAGMFYFPLSTRFEVDKDTYRLKGMFDSDYAFSLDKGLRAPAYESDVIKATAGAAPETLDKRKSGGVSGEVLRGVCDYGVAVLTAGAEEMLSGYIAASPITASYDPCVTCEVATVCRARKCAPKRRKQAAVKAETLLGCLVSDGQKGGRV